MTNHRALRSCDPEPRSGVTSRGRRHGARNGIPARAPWALIAIGALAVAVAACGGSTSSSSSTSGPTTTRGTGSPGSSTSTTGTSITTTSTGAGGTGCTTAALAVSIGAPNGSAGAVHYGLTFHNTGASSCTLYGYPGVSFLAAAGQQIGAPAQREGGAPTTVTLPGGGNAFASIAVTDPGIPPCTGSTAAAQIRVYPPGETQAVLVAAPSGTLVCSSPNTSAYQSASVTPVSATAL